MQLRLFFLSVGFILPCAIYIGEAAADSTDTEKQGCNDDDLEALIRAFGDHQNPTNYMKVAECYYSRRYPADRDALIEFEQANRHLSEQLSQPQKARMENIRYSLYELSGKAALKISDDARRDSERRDVEALDWFDRARTVRDDHEVLFYLAKINFRRDPVKALEHGVEALATGRLSYNQRNEIEQWASDYVSNMESPQFLYQLFRWNVLSNQEKTARKYGRKALETKRLDEHQKREIEEYIGGRDDRSKVTEKKSEGLRDPDEKVVSEEIGRGPRKRAVPPTWQENLLTFVPLVAGAATLIYTGIKGKQKNDELEEQRADIVAAREHVEDMEDSLGETVTLEELIAYEEAKGDYAAKKAEFDASSNRDERIALYVAGGLLMATGAALWAYFTVRYNASLKKQSVARSERKNDAASIVPQINGVAITF